MRRAAGSVFRSLVGSLPPRLGVTLHYALHHRRLPDLKHPRRFTEKLQARKLIDRDPRLPTLVDKVAVKTYVEDRLGPDWIIPTLWFGPTLPPRAERTWPVPFVLKSNNGSGTNLFVRSAADLEWARIEAKLAAWHPHGVWAREWAYGQVPSRLLVEPFVGDGHTLPVDYKIFVFAGRAQAVEVDTDRESGHKRTFYDRDWTRQDYALAYPREERPLPRPARLADMLAAAETLAADLPFVRVDFYEIAGQCLFGEMTFYPDGGIGRFTPDAMDQAFGALWP